MGRRKAGVTWVLMGPDPHLATCERCGRHVAAPELPMPLAAFSQYLGYAMALHAGCQAIPAEARS